ncbi:MAG: UTP--glucose-1-phosphate uridylyltransferase [Candidatus Omnitrophica bacterium]|nr:UTP--glucose-1-phosphate uridylyltransferase [Candidatus Omnitrophota bacterium]MDD5670276.1 UTP--glucose-1-phosphate uridylyltransferase [Candidatus Omnitrophota bacterium]
MMITGFFHDKRCKQFICALTAVTFFVTNLAFPASANAQPVLAPSLNPTASFDAQIPYELGEISEQVLPGGSDKLLVHIRTSHGHYEAQKNIQKLLTFLGERQGRQLLFLEGAARKLRPELFRFFPRDQELNQKIIDALIRQGELTGAEAYLIEAREKAEGWGVEDFEAYRRNREAFKSVMLRQEALNGFLKKFYVAWEKAAYPEFSEDLRSLLYREKAYREGSLSHQSWLEILRRQAAEHLKTDLNSFWSQERWPILVRYTKLREMEGKLDDAKVEKEKEIFFKGLEIYSNHDETKEIIRKLEEITATAKRDGGRVPRADRSTPVRLIVERLMDKLPENFPLTAAYPNFKAYLQYLIMAEELEAEGFNREIDRLTKGLFFACVRTKAEKKLLRVLFDYRLLEKLYRLELSRTEYLTIQKHQRRIRPTALAQFLSRQDLIQPDQDLWFKKAMGFYRGAIRREDWLVQNAVGKLVEKHQKQAILVTGGFHSEGVKERILKAGYAYVQITPRMTEVSKKDHEIYLRAFLGKPAAPKTPAKATIENALREDPATLIGVRDPELTGGAIETMRRTVRNVVAQERPAKVRELLEQLDRSRFAQVFGIGFSANEFAGGHFVGRSEVRMGIAMKFANDQHTVDFAGKVDDLFLLLMAFNGIFHGQRDRAEIERFLHREKDTTLVMGKTHRFRFSLSSETINGITMPALRFWLDTRGMNPKIEARRWASALRTIEHALSAVKRLQDVSPSPNRSEVRTPEQWAEQILSTGRAEGIPVTQIEAVVALLNRQKTGPKQEAPQFERSDLIPGKKSPEGDARYVVVPVLGVSHSLVIPTDAVRFTKAAENAMMSYYSSLKPEEVILRAPMMEVYDHGNDLSLRLTQVRRDGAGMRDILHAEVEIGSALIPEPQKLLHRIETPFVFDVTWDRVRGICNLTRLPSPYDWTGQTWGDRGYGYTPEKFEEVEEYFWEKAQAETQQAIDVMEGMSPESDFEALRYQWSEIWAKRKAFDELKQESFWRITTLLAQNLVELSRRLGRQSPVVRDLQARRTALRKKTGDWVSGKASLDGLYREIVRSVQGHYEEGDRTVYSLIEPTQFTELTDGLGRVLASLRKSHQEYAKLFWETEKILAALTQRQNTALLAEKIHESTAPEISWLSGMTTITETVQLNPEPYDVEHPDGGVLLIKPPAGQPYEETVKEILDRAEKRGYYADQIAVYEGSAIARLGIIPRHYENIYKVAKGGIGAMDANQRFALRHAYENELPALLGTAYSEDLVVAALDMKTKFGLSDDVADDLVLELWNRGMGSNYKTPRGVMKAAEGVYSYAFRLPEDPRIPREHWNKPVILANGFYMRFSKDFETPGTKTVAVLLRTIPGAEVSSWDDMRTQFAGDTNPAAALPGSIRNDALTGILKVAKLPVSTENNVIHLSDQEGRGREVVIWFPKRCLSASGRSEVRKKNPYVALRDEGMLATRDVDGLISEIDRLIAEGRRILQEPENQRASPDVLENEGGVVYEFGREIQLTLEQYYGVMEVVDIVAAWERGADQLIGLENTKEDIAMLRALRRALSARSEVRGKTEPQPARVKSQAELLEDAKAAYRQDVDRYFAPEERPALLAFIDKTNTTNWNDLKSEMLTAMYQKLRSFNRQVMLPQPLGSPREMTYDEAKQELDRFHRIRDSVKLRYLRDIEVLFRARPTAKGDVPDFIFRETFEKKQYEMTVEKLRQQIIEARTIEDMDQRMTRAIDARMRQLNRLAIRVRRTQNVERAGGFNRQIGIGIGSIRWPVPVDYEIYVYSMALTLGIPAADFERMENLGQALVGAAGRSETRSARDVNDKVKRMMALERSTQPVPAGDRLTVSDIAILASSSDSRVTEDLNTIPLGDYFEIVNDDVHYTITHTPDDEGVLKIHAAVGGPKLYLHIDKSEREIPMTARNALKVRQAVARLIAKAHPELVLPGRKAGVPSWITDSQQETVIVRLRAGSNDLRLADPILYLALQRLKIYVPDQIFKQAQSAVNAIVKDYWAQGNVLDERQAYEAIKFFYGLVSQDQKIADALIRVIRVRLYVLTDQYAKAAGEADVLVNLATGGVGGPADDLTLKAIVGMLFADYELLGQISGTVAQRNRRLKLTLSILLRTEEYVRVLTHCARQSPFFAKYEAQATRDDLTALHRMRLGLTARLTDFKRRWPDIYRSEVRPLEARRADAEAMLREYGQEHVLEHWNELDDAGKGRLLTRIEKINWKLLADLIEFAKSGAQTEIPSEFVPSRPVDHDELAPAVRAKGRETLQWEGPNGEVLTAGIMLAGGRGSGVEYNHPKGMYPIMDLSGESFYQTLIDRWKSLSRYYGHRKMMPLIVMTSEDTHEETLAYFREQNWFGEEEDRFLFVKQQELPVVDKDTYKVILKDKETIDVGGAGHGDAFDYVLQLEHVQAWLRKHGVKYVQYFAVDNVLNPIGDEAFIGQHVLSESMPRVPGEAHISIGMWPLENPDERAAHIVYVPEPDAADGLRREVYDYDKAPAAMKAQSTHGHPSFQIVTWETLRGSTPLRFRISKNKKPVIDSHGVAHDNTFKFESASTEKRSRGAILAFPRLFLAPLKYKEGKSPVDTPSDVRKKIAQFWRERLAKIHVTADETVMLQLPWVAAYMNDGEFRQAWTEHGLPDDLAAGVYGYWVDGNWQLHTIASAPARSELRAQSRAYLNPKLNEFLTDRQKQELVGYLGARGITEQGFIGTTVTVMDGVLPVSLGSLARPFLTPFFGEPRPVEFGKDIDAAKRLLSTNDMALGDVFILSSGFALSEGGLEAVLKLYPAIPIIIIAPEESRRQFLAENYPRVVVAKDVTELQSKLAEMQVPAVSALPLKRKVTAITSSEELELASRLKQISDQVTIMTSKMMERFKQFVGQQVQDLMTALRGRMQVSRAA